MKCLKCGQSVKEPKAYSWEFKQWCPECFNKSKFQQEEIIKLEAYRLVEKGSIIRLKSTPMDYFLDKFTIKEVLLNE